jgi:hypothetical protein
LKGIRGVGGSHLDARNDGATGVSYGAGDGCTIRLGAHGPGHEEQHRENHEPKLHVDPHF